MQTVPSNWIAGLIGLCALMIGLILINSLTGYKAPEVTTLRLGDGRQATEETIFGPADDLAFQVGEDSLFVAERGRVVEPEPVISAAPVVMQSAPQIPSTGFPEVALVGIMISDTERNAVLRFPGRADSVILGLGERVRNWELRIIEEDRVSFTYEGETIWLQLWENEHAQQTNLIMPAHQEIEAHPSPSEEIRPRGTRMRRPIGEE